MARVGGLLYLVIIVLGLLGEAVVRGSIVVAGDAAATARNLRSMELLWRLGVAGELVLLTCATGLALILYVLLRRVGREVALLAVFLYLVSIAIEAGAAVSLAVALFPLSDASYLAAFTVGQLDALAMLSVRSHAMAFGVALVFFGWQCMLTGYLIYRSGYMPRVIGGLMAIAGICYVINSYALVLSPPLSSRLYPAILLPSFVGELSLALWLLIKGVNADRWAEHS